MNNIWLLIVAAIISIALVCVLSCCQNVARSVPINYILLMAFTVCEAYTVAFSCVIVNDGLTVLAAAFMTAAIVIALTIYAAFTKTDFTVCGGAMAIVGGIFVIFSLFSFMFGPTFHLILACVGVFIFGIYLIIDTQLILGGKRQYSLDKDDYIMGAMILYLDIINIFLYLLEILKGNSD